MQEIIQNVAGAVRAHARGLAVRAANIARAGSENPRAERVTLVARDPGGVEAIIEPMPAGQAVDLAEETVGLMSSRRAIEANLAVARTSDKTLGVLLDTFG